MCSRLTVSAVFVFGLVGLSAVGQPPGGADQKQPPAEKAKPDPTANTVAAALANDPDVKVARAKVQLAEAELTKAKQAVTIRVIALLTSIKEAKVALDQAQERAAWTDRMVAQGHVAVPQAQAERAKLESAKLALTRLETELKLLTGGDAEFKVVELDGGTADAVARGLAWLTKAQQSDDSAALAALALLNARMGSAAVKGPIPDRIRAALDKPVKLGAKGEKVTFEQALEVFKRDAGLDVPVRPMAQIKGITSEGEQLPVGAWFQLFADENLDARFFVREYGLLVTTKPFAPPDAVSLTEFWKQRLPEKKEPAPGPKETGK